mmetsp:Transcript_65123/g.181077  ORF Transcript_65123/g.181077 Transcript_65123/m.181077 type:complete len:242 (+) Transcript_65123:752-1477(+)
MQGHLDGPDSAQWRPWPRTVVTSQAVARPHNFPQPALSCGGSHGCFTLRVIGSGLGTLGRLRDNPCAVQRAVSRSTKLNLSTDMFLPLAACRSSSMLDHVRGHRGARIPELGTAFSRLGFIKADARRCWRLVPREGIRIWHRAAQLLDGVREKPLRLQPVQLFVDVRQGCLYSLAWKAEDQGADVRVQRQVQGAAVPQRETHEPAQGFVIHLPLWVHEWRSWVRPERPTHVVTPEQPVAWV